MYNAIYFENPESYRKIEIEKKKLEQYNWENEDRYRPETKFTLAFFKDYMEVRMWTDEKELRSECVNTNDPCWEDSCMEFFFAPFGKEEGYINIECNSKSVYLSEFGKGKANRVFLNSITEKEPEVKSFVNEDGWELVIKVKYDLISDVFERSFDPLDADFYFNVYKCGDKTSHPHYLSFMPMGSLPPGFHNPECFSEINISKA